MQDFNAGDQIWSRGTYLDRPIVVRRVITVEDGGDAENGPRLELSEQWREARFLDTGKRIYLDPSAVFHDLELTPADEVLNMESDYIPCWDYDLAEPMYVLPYQNEN